MSRADHHLTHAALQLKDLMKQISGHYFAAANVMREIREMGSADEIESLVGSRATMSPKDLQTLGFVAGLMQEIPDVLNDATISPAALTILSRASEEVQERALHVLKHNKRLDAFDLEQISQRMSQESETEWERSEKARSRYLESLMADRLSHLEGLAGDLQARLDRFVLRYCPHPEDEDALLRPESDGYGEAFNSIVDLAGRILPIIDGLFGELPFDGGSPDSTDLANAALAVRRLADGAFSHNGGFGFDAVPIPVWSTELRDALDFLVPGAAPEPGSIKPTRRLKVLELFAGAGGTSIGLMSAGFEHAALIEKSPIRAQTLKRNWPTWNVVNKDIAKISYVNPQERAEIDLLVAGLPFPPGEESVPKDASVPQVLRALKGILPRGVMVQFDLGQRQTGGEEAIAALLTEVKEAGYRVHEFALDTINFGIPHSREHGFIVGIRNDVAGVLPDPRMVTPVVRDVVKALQSSIAPHQTPPPLSMQVELGTPQRVYDMWARNWAQVHRGKMLPSIFRGIEKRKDWMQPWLDAGFNPSDIREPPKVGSDDLRNTEFKPFITLEILAAAQGFPPGWKFLAEKTGIIDMIADALPPVMAKVVALSIRAVLSGETVNLDQAVVEPIIELSRIGLGELRPRLNGPRRRWPGDRDTPSAWIHDQATRVILGAKLADVERNHKKRGAIRKEIPRVYEKWAYLMQLEREEREESVEANRWDALKATGQMPDP
ncbi:DNA cytosine methyltransferase [Rhizobium sp. CRRU65]|uniref:DNA cytosine methyltransferase n=1 Tax=Rhizobium sp. CRRU65 TaxID=3399566 RepID=UPI003AF6CAE2